MKTKKIAPFFLLVLIWLSSLIPLLAGHGQSESEGGSNTKEMKKREKNDA